MTVFTCVLGQTDRLRPCRAVPGVRYLVFADVPLNVPPYQTIEYDAGSLGPRLASRELKILANHAALEGDDLTLWHDAAFALQCNPLTLAEGALATSDVVAFRHPHRNRIEAEAEAVASLGYMPRDVVRRQVAHYRAAGFTHQHAITSTGFCLRRRTAQVDAWQRAWWDEVAHWGWRDQLSVDYALWKTSTTVEYIAGHYRHNPYAVWHSESGAPVRARASRFA